MKRFFVIIGSPAMSTALIYTCSVSRSVLVFSGAMNVIMEFPNEGMQLFIS